MDSFLAQVADYAPIVSSVGFPGVVLIILVRWLERMDHTLQGLSRALWCDLASRPGVDAYIKQEAKRMMTKIDGQK